MPVIPDYYSKPGQLRQEYAVDEVLQASTVPGAALSAIRPPVPQVLLPSRYGYRRTPLTIQDVLATDRWAPAFRSWTSGAPSMSNPRVDENFGHEGSLRNAYTGLHYETG